MTAPDLQDYLTNELTINRLSLALNKIYGLPDAKYKFAKYDQDIGEGIVARIYLEHENIKVIVRVTGPCIEGSRMDWGLKVGNEAMTEVPTNDGTRLIIIEGYLKQIGF